MATNAELYDLHNYTPLINSVVVECVAAAEMVHNELDTTPNHANRLIWAAGVFVNPKQEAQRMYWALLAANRDLNVAAIKAATDEQVQAGVEAHINLFATGG